MASQYEPRFESIYSRFVTRQESVEAPMWIRKDSGNWNDESLSSNSSTSPDSLSPLNSPPAEYSTSQCSSSGANKINIPAKRAIKKIRNVRKSDKYHCIVCGDKPTGYHYDVLSCNGCKTFFRRTIINNRTFKCTKGGNCQFTKDFRCACRACRFEKCVKVGMNKTAIQYPTKSEEYDEADVSGDDFQPTTSERNSHGLTERLQNKQLFALQCVDAIVARERAAHSFRRCDFQNIHLSQSLKDLLREPSILGKTSPEYKPSKLYTENPIKFWMLCDLYLVVEFAKTFDAFRLLSEDDQTILIAHIGGLLHIASQSYYSYYDTKSKSLTFPDGLNALQRKSQDTRANGSCFRESFSQYYLEMYNLPVMKLMESGLNEREFAFFKAIALFSPNEMEMSRIGREIVAEERHRITELLRQYLLAEYGLKSGLEKLSTILISLSTFVKYGEKRREHLEMCNLMQFDLSELTKDIYLKRHPQNFL
ncbi:unnamed protein product [Caenorhabditis auriculariae]|uniref:Uncharacterized protein n=1 Tax=Caenorhabditis auriculariae TaxID=2777116 RepID=A0A8S1GRD8_9PELO|nr:unnamed protein product [Caenorhabditis auriculariae]